MKVKSPSGAERTYVYVTHPEVVKDADGKYHIDVLCAESGDYLVRAIGTGAVPSGSPDQVIHVQPSKFKQPL
jgi:hypothetical protein